MVHLKYTLVAVLLIALPFCWASFNNRGKDKENPKAEIPAPIIGNRSPLEAAWFCVNQQICKCGNYDRFRECLDESPKEVEDWSIDVVNEHCTTGIETLQYGNVRHWTNIFCSLNETVKKACYDKVYPIIFDRQRNPTLEESNTIEDIRVAEWISMQ